MRNEAIFWACLALLLIAAEVLAPGVFMLWLGVAAAAVFAIVLLIPGIPPLVQAIAFVLLSFGLIAVYRQFFRHSDKQSDQPLLNRKAEQLIGKVLPLHQAIVNGQGRVKLGDALWTVEGPDLPQGTQVRVIGATSMTLKVDPAE
jgi:membrane protein implicated in regulation of membrane protease activity